MTLLEELQILTKNYNSPKIKEVKEILKTKASEGGKSVNIESNQYDKNVIYWLEAQGLDVEEISDQRSGNFLRITWIY